MVDEQKDMRVPSGLIPLCPVCGSPLMMNLRSDDRFVEDAGWRQAAARYDDFIRRHKGTRILFLRLSGIQHARNHQISVLADDGGKSKRDLCLCQRW